MKKQLVLAVFLLMSLSFSAQNTSVQERFNKANEAYNNAKYEKAAELYRSILELDSVSAELHFNLANTELKQNNLGQAILHYEKALKLKPNQVSFQENLAYANSLTVDEIQSIEKSQLQIYIDKFNFLFSVDQWSYLVVSLAALMFFAFLAYVFSTKTFTKRLFFTGFIVFLVLAAISFSQAYRLDHLQQSQQYAIILSEEVPALAEPNARSSQVLTLHEGTKVKLLSKFNNYQEVQLADGTKIWISTKAFKKI
ncbi:tetratricopeptide repeat protein [Psychroflexus sp. ALD_RP9]|uniref:tetratricopeptide repeat protein n=1 Tax=Psychroflexus sp. ALD_RP9 TaxID=2777186 RepID=UPI001A90222E|nr:tetratricopeptide repeat protein [Psychroflexus sp. ALD_RP9]QSS97909.1 tetratricopeptide repeat protein [Psychroflexus sp. ALD_RP9]